MTMGYVLSNDGFEQVIQSLGQKYRLFAPVRKKGAGRFTDIDVILYDEVKHADEIELSAKSDYSFKEFRDGPRNDPASPTYGLLGWAYTHKWVYYGDDNARSILGTILAAKVLGTDKWNQKIAEAIDANFNTTGKNGFRGGRLHEQDIQQNGLEFYQNRDLINPHPHYESWIWACYLWQYANTGDSKYLNLTEKAISLTMAAYPDGWSWTNGIQQERARMLLPLAWLYRVSPTEES